MLSGIGGIMAVLFGYFSFSYEIPEHRMILSILALIPAAALFIVARYQSSTPKTILSYLQLHSGIALTLIFIILLTELIEQSIDSSFIFLTLPGIILTILGI